MGVLPYHFYATAILGICMFVLCIYSWIRIDALDIYIDKHFDELVVTRHAQGARSGATFQPAGCWGHANKSPATLPPFSWGAGVRFFVLFRCLVSQKTEACLPPCLN